MLCADGKKVTAGINKNGGDVDMFRFEDGVPLHEKQTKLKLETDTIQSTTELVQSLPVYETIEYLPRSCRESITNGLKQSIIVVSSRLKDCKELKLRQDFGLKKFMTLGGEKWRESKYVYAISSLQASLHQLVRCVTTALSTISAVCRILSSMQTSVSPYTESYVDPSFQKNMLLLFECENPVETRYLKQRTEIWKQLRKSAKVTGSTMHNAIGLRGLKQQKLHFDSFITGTAEKEFPKEVQERLDYGTENEANAIATLVGVILPAMYPSLTYVEEGCYIGHSSSGSIIAEVSPDGSLREVSFDESGQPISIGNAVSAIEIKCPFPTENRVTVHYTLPAYYAIQCLAEMHVLNTNTLLYVSYSEKSTTVFNVEYDEDMWNLIWNEVLDIYDRTEISKPTKSRENVKYIKEKLASYATEKVKFCGEFPSRKLLNSSLSRKADKVPFTCAQPVTRAHEEITIGDVSTVVAQCISVTEDGYQLLRKKATEVMVWVVTNKHRNSKLEIPCSLPVAFGLKDYRLTSKAMRNATEHVLDEFRTRGLRIDSLSTDGQWVQLMLRNEDGTPSTVYQLQKDVWQKVRKMSKQELLKSICTLNIVDNSEGSQTNTIDYNREPTSHAIVLKSKDKASTTIVTSQDRKLWQTKSKSATDKDNDMEDTENDNNDNTELDSTDLGWLPAELLRQIEEHSHSDLAKAVSLVDKALNENRKAAETNDMFNISETYNVFNPNNDMTTNIEQLFDNEIQTPDRPLQQNIANETNSATPNGQETENVESSAKPLSLKINEELVYTVMQSLKKCSEKWKAIDDDMCKSILTTREKLSSLTHSEINTIYEDLVPIITTTLQDIPILRKSWNKKRKLVLMNSILGLAELPSTFNEPQRIRLRSPSPLKKMVTKVLKSRKVPKDILAVAYSNYIFGDELKVWQDKSTIRPDVKVDGFENDILFWYSHPEYNSHSGALLTKSIDCSHNVTHLRVRTSTTGICGIPSTAWKACAESNETKLKVSHVLDLLDKQSVPNARTHFSEEVETWMIINGFEETAKLVNLIKKWYEANDAPAISAIERVKYLVAMRQFLLSGVNFGKFPPITRYIKQIPIVTYEGLLVDIDSKLQLYSITGSYNIRSVGSLTAETTVGVLQSLNPTSQVSIKAVDVPSLLSNTVAVMTCKINPDRGFFMRTARRSGIYPEHEGSKCREDESTNQSLNPRKTVISSLIIPSDHPFDRPDRKLVSRKIRFGTISDPSAPSRGALPVRQWHRRNESKIIATKRLGLLS